MVATVVRLRARILRHTLARETWRLVVLIAGALWALSMLPSVAGGMVWLSGQPAEVAHDVLVVGGALLVVGWTVVPVLIPGLDDALEIDRFATFGVPVRRLVPGLLAASFLGVPTLFTTLVCFAPVLAWSGHAPAGALTAAVAAPLALAPCLLGARLSTGLMARLLGSRRSRELGAVGGLLVVGAVVPGVVAVGALGIEGALERVPAVATVLGWTPLGLAWAAPAAVVQGDVAGGVLRLVLAAGWAVVGVLAWMLLLRRALVSPPARGGEVRRRADSVLPARDLVGRPGLVAARAVSRRALRYWGSDPRYVNALLGAVVAPVAIVLLVATVVDAPAAVALSMGPLMAGSVGWGRHNDVAYDGSAFWMHVSARVPGWADRLGRAAATLTWGLPLTVVVSLAGAWVAGRPDLGAAAVGAALGVLGAGLGVSAVFSTVLPYPVAEAGASPFVTPSGSVGASMVAQVVTSAATAALSLPVLVAYGATLWWNPALAPVTLVLGVLGGAGVLLGGVRVGGRIFDGRSPRVLARLR